jgi:predicted RNA binding protein YcfA (HicA-like mRNA interferase family)
MFANYNISVIFVMSNKIALCHMKFSELYRKLERAGWYLDRTSKHKIYVHNDHPGVTIPVGKHPSKEVPFGTMKSILKAAGLK